MAVIPFTGPINGWSQLERRALSDLRQHLAQTTTEPRLTTGVSDEGDAWAVITDSYEECFLVHVARRGAGVVLIWRKGPTIFGLALRNLVNALLLDAPELVAEQSRTVELSPDNTLRCAARELLAGERSGNDAEIVDFQAARERIGPYLEVQRKR